MQVYKHIASLQHQPFSQYMDRLLNGKRCGSLYHPYLVSRSLMSLCYGRSMRQLSCLGCPKHKVQSMVFDMLCWTGGCIRHAVQRNFLQD